MIDHVGCRGGRARALGGFYDAVFLALGGRRVHEGAHAIAYGVTAPVLWIVARGRPPAPGYGHIAFRAAGRAAVDAAYAAGLAAGGRGDGAPGLRTRYGPLYYAAYVRDPDGLRVEFVADSR